MCLRWFKRTPSPVLIPDPIPDPVPEPVVIFHRDFTGSKFDWSDWYLFTGKGMRGIYPDFMRRVIWIRENVIPSEEGLKLVATTGDKWSDNWESDGYYTQDWFTGRYSLCGKICSFHTGLKRGVTLKHGNRLDVVLKLPRKGYTYFPTIYCYNAETGHTDPVKNSQKPEPDLIEAFGSPQNEYLIGGKTNYLRFSLHREGVQSVSVGHVFPVELNLDFHTFSLIYQADFMSWLVDGIEMFRVTENIPTCELLFEIGMQSGSATPQEQSYTHVFTPEEEGEAMIVKSTTVSKI